MTLTRWAAVLSAGGSLFFLAMSAVLAYETYALWTGHRTVTDQVRDFGAAHPQWSTLAAVLVALLLGHFLWHGSGSVARELARRKAED